MFVDFDTVGRLLCIICHQLTLISLKRFREPISTNEHVGFIYLFDRHKPERMNRARTYQHRWNV
jgi:hypothetical protein